MKVKVCGMTDLPNLNSVVASEPDFVGFIFYSESSRRVSNEKILFASTGKVRKVGVFVNEQRDTLLAVSSIYKLDMVQLHGDESSDYCKELKQNGLKIIKAFSISDGFDFSELDEYAPFVDYFLFDTKGKYRGGNGSKFNWRMLNNYKLDMPFFLSGGITEKDVEEITALSHSQLFGVDVNSGFETSPGVKDVPSVERFIKNIKTNAY
jgi:phosphoribosylanthranilate isomerase